MSRTSASCERGGAGGLQLARRSRRRRSVTRGSRGERDVRGDDRDGGAERGGLARRARSPSGPTSGCRRSARRRSARACRRRVTSTRRPTRSGRRRAARRARVSASIAASSAAGSGRRPAPASPLEASRPAAGLEHGRRRARAASRRSPASPGAPTCGCSSRARRAAGRWRRARRSSGGCRPGRARAWRSCSPMAGAMTKTSALRTSSRWLSGSCSGGALVGEGAARRVALELVVQHRRAGQRGERRGADEALRWPASG